MAKYKEPDFAVRQLQPGEVDRLVDAGAKCVCPRTGEYAQGTTVVQPVRNCPFHGEESASAL
jgi:hypothetical protein